MATNDKKQVDIVNEYKYLNSQYANAQKTGNTGLANWAKSQGSKYGITVGDQNIAATPSTNNTNSSSNNGGYDIQPKLDQMRDAQLQSKIAALDNVRNQALSNLNKEKSAISPIYQQKRNDASTQSQIQARNFAEYYAQRGMNNPTGINGSMAQNDIASNIALQNNMSNLGMQEAMANQDIERRITDVNNGYNTDVANAKSDIDSQYMKNSIDAYDKKYAYDRQDEQIAYERNIAAQQAERQKALDEQARKANELEYNVKQLEYQKAQTAAPYDKQLLDLQIKQEKAKLAQTYSAIAENNAQIKKINSSITNGGNKKEPTVNESYATLFNNWSKLPVQQVYNNFTDPNVKAQMISLIGSENVSKLWNDVMQNAINRGDSVGKYTIQPYDKMFKAGF